MIKINEDIFCIKAKIGKRVYFIIRGRNAPRDLLINRGKRWHETFKREKETKCRICIPREIGEFAGSDPSGSTQGKKVRSEDVRMESWAESKWMACRAHGRVMRDVPYTFPSLMYYGKLAFVWKIRATWLKGFAKAEQARLVNFRKRVFQPENIGDDDSTLPRNPISEFITFSTVAKKKITC